MIGYKNRALERHTYISMNKIFLFGIAILFLTTVSFSQQPSKAGKDKPNIIIIYADDLGYGDVSCYGATKIKTPNIDKLSEQGLRFTDSHATSATCTPSRYSLLTGQYAWRKKGTDIAPGNAAALIKPGTPTLPSMLQNRGYKTGVVGKWHLGLGGEGGPNWNEEIHPGPSDIGFNYSYLIPATGDRVPCVFVENSKVVNLNPNDPIQVSYDHPIGNEPTGKDHPELLKMQPSHGHNNTIVNGISRIGYMSGGKEALWTDENIADVLITKAKDFIIDNKNNPFFLYFATHDIHVPRVPNKRFVGKSGLGARGDVILQLDWTVGEITKLLDSLKLADNTLIIFSSDNGPVVDDGYKDKALELLNGHKPAGVLRGGKYSAFDGGTRVPFIVKWNGKVKPGTSDASFSHIDLFASLAALTNQKLANDAAPDSHNALNTLLGKTNKGRDFIIEHAMNGTLSIIKGKWKYIEPSNGRRIDENTNIELGNYKEQQLYDLSLDLGEKNNVATANPAVAKELSELLASIKSKKEL